MDIASLHAFVTIADHGSFSSAANRLHVTQPAVSKRIATLEEELNVRLFDRLGRTVRLTEAGTLLLPRARRILAEVDDSRRALRNLSGLVTGTLTLATSHHIGLHRLPPVLRIFTARYPRVRLDMRFMDSEVACAVMLRGETELAIITLPPDVEAPLETLPLWPDPLVIVASRTHPLARSPVTDLKQLAEHPAILPSEATFTRRIFEQELARLDASISIAFATNYLETIKMMVAVGLGWSVLPRTMLDGDLVEIPIAGLSLERMLGVVRHTGHTLSNAAKALLNILQDPSMFEEIKNDFRTCATDISGSIQPIDP
ncbi:MAG: LysR family transcriptional regulator [Candidatus Competibacteraceae bacterium]|nr:LysR family transcriptional regulator [Candidatus Competibacteraceae bacterium]MBK8899142.1 LysR family transcriptional regulator [Candidatus Competibacteraceae bacterium]MBK8963179.1 LysR family transcriptional regulator [Candidatus Competibacteraceae bacterium]